MSLRRTSLTAIVTAALSAVLLTAATVGVAAARPAAGTARASVPWNRVGAGWVLTQYTSAAPAGRTGPAELYLISPSGTRYQLASWPNWRFAPQLVAWSPDGQRARFQGTLTRAVPAAGWAAAAPTVAAAVSRTALSAAVTIAVSEVRRKLMPS